MLSSLALIGPWISRNSKGQHAKVRRNVLEAFRVSTAQSACATLTPAHVSAITGHQANFPGAANNLLKVLRVLLRHAIDMGLTQ